MINPRIILQMSTSTTNIFEAVKKTPRAASSYIVSAADIEVGFGGLAFDRTTKIKKKK